MEISSKHEIISTMKSIFTSDVMNFTWTADKQSNSSAASRCWKLYRKSSLFLIISLYFLHAIWFFHWGEIPIKPVGIIKIRRRRREQRRCWVAVMCNPADGCDRRRERNGRRKTKERKRRGTSGLRRHTHPDRFITRLETLTDKSAPETAATPPTGEMFHQLCKLWYFISY